MAAQFWNQKGDLGKDSRGNKINTIMPKLICLYEDVVDEAGETSKLSLIHICSYTAGR